VTAALGRSTNARFRRVLGMLAALSVLPVAVPGLAGASHDAFGPPTVTVLTLPANDLAYDRRSDTIYASVPSRAGVLGNRIATIDPDLGELGPSVFVGSEPSPLATSDDGEFTSACRGRQRFGASTCPRSHPVSSSRSGQTRSRGRTSRRTSR
jgi:hypothetical protein